LVQINTVYVGYESVVGDNDVVLSTTGAVAPNGNALVTLRCLGIIHDVVIDPPMLKGTAAYLISIYRVVLQVVKVIAVDRVVLSSRLDAVLVLGPIIIWIIDADHLVVIERSAFHPSNAIVTESRRAAPAKMEYGIMDEVYGIAGSAATLETALYRSVTTARKIYENVI